MKTMDRTLTENDNHNFNERSNITQLSSPPMFSGSLELLSVAGIGPIASRLLPCWQAVSIFGRSVCEADTSFVTALVLVEGCLESVEIDSGTLGTSV